MTKALRYGPSRCLASPLYLKRRHAASVTAMQEKWPLDRIRAAWFDAWERLLAAALPTAATGDDVRRIVRAVLGRVALSAPDMDWFFDVRGLDRDERRQLVTRFLEYVRAQRTIDLVSLLGEDRGSIQRWSLREIGLEQGLLGSLRREYRRFRRRRTEPRRAGPAL